MCVLQVTDAGIEIVKSMVSLVTLHVMGCHRLTPAARTAVSHLSDFTTTY